MARGRRSGATAAAALPAALAGAALVAAPFAGTTTSPLAKSTTRADVRTTQAHDDSALSLRVPAASVAVLASAELLLVGVGAGVIVVARRGRPAED